MKSFQNEERTVLQLVKAIRNGCAIAPIHRSSLNADNFVSAELLGLDFDTEDERSRLWTLLAHPFIAQYAAILHTTTRHTEEAPRAGDLHHGSPHPHRGRLPPVPTSPRCPPGRFVPDSR